MADGLFFCIHSFRCLEHSSSYHQYGRIALTSGRKTHETKGVTMKYLGCFEFVVTGTTFFPFFHVGKSLTRNQSIFCSIRSSSVQAHTKQERKKRSHRNLLPRLRQELRTLFNVRDEIQSYPLFFHHQFDVVRNPGATVLDHRRREMRQ